MRTSLLVGSSLCLVAGVWSCDSLWSSSVVDCGRSGFKCPEGYTPPGQDLSMNDSDGGSSGGDGGGSGGMDMASTVPAHTSVYTVPGPERLTLVGTADGIVKVYKDSGTGVPGKLSEATEDAGTKVVGVWQGKINDSMMPERKLRIVALNNKKIIYRIDNQQPVTRVTTQNINSMWVGGWNEEASYNYTDIRMFTAGDAGELTEWSIATDANISKLSAPTLGSPASKLTAVAGFANIGGYSLMMNCMSIPNPCSDGVAWVAGEGGSLYYFASPGMGMPFAWQPVATFGNKAGAAYQAIGMGLYSAPRSNALVSVVSAGNGGIYAEQEAPGWVGTAAGAGAFGNKTIRAISYCNNNEAWAVGDGGSVYRGVYSDATGKMVWGAQSLIGGRDFGTTTFYGVHCAPANGTRPQRVSVVGGGGSFLYTDYNMTLGSYGPWQLALEQ